MSPVYEKSRECLVPISAKVPREIAEEVSRLADAGVGLFALARRMGTSLEMIDKTYGHLLPDAVDYERGLLDAFDAREASGQLSDTGVGLV